MRVVIFCHSLVSDWNNGHAHFLRGIATELLARGHEVACYEPRNGWSRQNLLADAGPSAIDGFHAAYPWLDGVEYDLETLDVDAALAGVSLVLVHEWNDPALVSRIGAHRAARGRYALLFHDSHHRSVSDQAAIGALDLRNYDGVLAFSASIAEVYRRQGWMRQTFVWHEAADTRMFRPLPEVSADRDLVWIGNWGDEERTAELQSFLVSPVRALGLSARAYGVRYPAAGRELLGAVGIEYCGWAPNYRVSELFARHRVTVHIPRRPYGGALPGVPTIRVFEALACGIPLVCGPWDDVEGLFTPGEDFLIARSDTEMTGYLQSLLMDREWARALAERGRRTVLRHHTCAHRVDELLRIWARLTGGSVVGAESPSRASDGAVAAVRHPR
jgi:spore maturation protein CgeB